MKLYISTRQCPLGTMLLAADSHGVRALVFGDTEGRLLPQLASWFPGWVFVRDDLANASHWADAVLSYFGDPRTRLQVPLVLEGSDFQTRVWSELLGIPSGETRTYAEVAGRIGQPRAARAVARACATNRIALLVPCHRVIRSDGTLSGYRWGRSRKEWLLNWEAQWVAGKESPTVETGQFFESVEHILGDSVAVNPPRPVAVADAR